MASVAKDPNGRWRARWRTPTGASRSRTFKLKRDASACIDKIAEDKAKGAYVDPGAGKITFRAFTDEWRREVVDLRASTLARDLGYLDRYLLPTFGDLKLRDITTPMVRAWVAQMNSTGPLPWWDVAEDPKRKVRTLSPTTVGTALGLLKKILKVAEGDRRIASNPARDVARPSTDTPERRYLTFAEVLDLADAIDPRYRALVFVGCFGALRFGEIAGLRRSRVDVLRGTVEVAEKITEVSGHLHYSRDLKTGAGRRTVPRFPRWRWKP